jgi:orotidine-5'-phosphate decarboxylase
MDTAKLTAGERLICALDVPDVGEARRIVEELDGLVTFYKVGMTLYLAGGLGLAQELIGEGKRVFLDLKLYDIEETVELAVREAARQGMTFLTVHGNNGIIRGAVRGRGQSDLKLLVVTVLTSLDQDDLAELGYPVPLADLVMSRAKNSLAHGADGVVASPLEAGLVKRQTAGKLLVVSPGIRDADAPGDDQKRTMSADAAIEAGADFLVVGRPITAPRDGKTRRQAAIDIISKMEQGIGLHSADNA